MKSSGLSEQNPAVRRYGAVAVIVREERLLVIKRSQHVLAPGELCFPGGGIEPGETDSEALVREIQEELGCQVRPLRRLWENVSPWRVHLAWWSAEFADRNEPAPNPLEVESVHWMTLDEMAAQTNLLETNRRFVEAVKRGEISLA